MAAAPMATNTFSSAVPSMTGTSTAATGTESMAAQSGEGNALQKRSPKIIYALPSCMGFGADNCPYSRKMIHPIDVPDAPPALNNIMINDRNNAPGPAGATVHQMTTPSTVVSATPAYTEEPAPTVTEKMRVAEFTYAAEITHAAETRNHRVCYHATYETIQPAVPVTQTTEIPPSTVTMMVPTIPAPQGRVYPFTKAFGGGDRSNI
ncbi:hypothetical protein BC938DRAFT_479706 [Jimgerdemannia flammicorona]|uniref:Uncharacterized protein n=1 Tax=Jimgerdemannia flammicorona TaxID=994334 RepID=A0A433QKB8_9FUNG|nr:hypothetical protein BC938DRAFT_479706 [Jimgerdemannia flammicorona]